MCLDHDALARAREHARGSLAGVARPFPCGVLEQEAKPGISTPGEAGKGDAPLATPREAVHSHAPPETSELLPQRRAHGRFSARKCRSRVHDSSPHP